MNYSNLRTQILASMKYPPKITAQALQEQLINIVNGLDLGALLLGVATPLSTPDTQANGFYFGLQPGTYTNFPTINGETITVDSSEVAIIVRSGNYWSKIHITTYPSIDPTTKHWMIGNEDTGVLAEGTDGVTPHIDPETGNWFIGTTNTGIHAQGVPGKDAYQPFKGSFDSVQDLNAAYPEPNDGDMAYVEDTVDNATVLKVYDVVNGEWHDTGTTADSPVFGSGQFLSSVKIDNTQLANPADGSLPKAEDAMQLKAKLQKVSAKDEKIEITDENTHYGYVKSEDGGIFSTQQNQYFQIPINTATVHLIRFQGRTRLENASTQSGYALGYYEEGHDLDEAYWHSVFYSGWEVADEAVVKEIQIPITDALKSATYFRTTCRIGPITFDNFYCYLRLGSEAISTDNISDGLLCDDDDVLGGNAGRIIDSRTRRSVILSKYNGILLSRYINVANNVWLEDAHSRSTLVNIRSEVGKKLYIKKAEGISTHVAFLTDKGATGEAPAYVSGTSMISLTASNGKTEELVTIPTGAVYMYVKLMDGTDLYNPAGPDLLEIVENDNVVASNRYKKNYSDTYIEEDVYEQSGQGIAWITKTYKIQQNEKYRIILYQPASNSLLKSVIYLAKDKSTELGYAYPQPNVNTFTEMEELTIPNGCAFIKITYQLKNDGSNYRSRVGIGALMKPLRDDGTFPTNRINYCVSRIYTDAKRNGYDGAEDVQQPTWSAWAFMMPTAANSYEYSKPLPVCSWFHGSSTCLTPDHFGNAGGNGIVGNIDSSSMPFALRDLGCIVFDINGYGISYCVDDKARHWGCPMAVATAKRAYEIIVERFNGRRGFINCGWSMGGAIAKSYAMTYPNDVVACALFAPSEIGGNGRFHNPVSDADYHVSEESMAHAWGYQADGSTPAWDVMYNDHTMSPFVGYSPCVKPHVINQDLTLRKIQDNEFLTVQSISDNTDIFVGSFPCEVRVWAGTEDDQVPYFFAEWFVNTVRNAGGNATLRTCQGASHDLFYGETNYKDEILSYIKSKLIAQ